MNCSIGKWLRTGCVNSTQRCVHRWHKDNTRETFVPDCPSMDIDAATHQSMVQLLPIVPLLPQPILLQIVLTMTMMSLRTMLRTMMMTMQMMMMTMKTNDDEHKADNEDPPAHLMSPPHSIHPPPQIPTYPIVISENPALEATIIITSILLPCPSHQLHQLGVAPPQPSTILYNVGK